MTVYFKDIPNINIVQDQVNSTDDDSGKFEWPQPHQEMDERQLIWLAQQDTDHLISLLPIHDSLTKPWLKKSLIDSVTPAEDKP